MTQNCAMPIWFGPEERPLFGWVHSPASGSARAGVVICPAMDMEYILSHYAVRLLAERAADLGMLALRFDYDGTGNSAGQGDDPDRVDAWKRSVKLAIEQVRALGATRVVLVGLRIGAVLAGVVAEQEEELEGLVLWDPVISGRAYLSHQRALAALALETGDAPPGMVHGPGYMLDTETAASMRALDLGATKGPLASRVLVLERPDQETTRLRARFGMDHVEFVMAPGQTELLERGSPDQVLPYGTIEAVATWISDHLPQSEEPIRPVPAAGSATVYLDGRDRTPVVESPMRIGEAGLFGVLAEPPGGRTGPTVLFLSVANEHHVGPNRLWVELARRWAALGFRSFRFDLSGLGDSPTRYADQARFVPRTPEAFDDVLDAARAVEPADPGNVVMVGLCAAAYQALDSAFQVKPRGVIAVNPVLSFAPPEVAEGGPADPRRKVALVRNPLVEAFRGDGRMAALRRRFPNLGWRIRTLAARRRRPSRWLQELVDLGCDVLLVCGEREARPIRSASSPRALRRLEASGRFHFDYVPDLQHGLLLAHQRVEVCDTLTAHMQERFGRSLPVPAENSAVTVPSKEPDVSNKGPRRSLAGDGTR